MALENTNPTGTVAWNKLREHFEQICYTSMQEFFAQDQNRANRFHIEWNNFLLDYSKNKISLKTMDLFVELAEELGLKSGIESLFSGEKINITENRAVLHTALRTEQNQTVLVDGKNIIPEVIEVKEKIKLFSESVIGGDRKGYSGKPFTDVINIGIGGSDLGPAMVTEALRFYKNHLNIHYVSNIDGDGVSETLKSLNPETTLFVIVSKTFTTQETITNAKTIRNWFLQSANQSDIAKHFVAVSSNIEKVKEFGISEENIFPMWDWVGGRYSLWSAVGISIALGVGYDNFDRLLKGANSLDNHFRTADFRTNIPVVLAFLSVWYNNFFESETHCVVPYSDYLKKFVPYLQQLVMESNGKSISREGTPVNTQTGNVIFGGIGTNSQHAFFQLLHQGTKLVPADFIGFVEPLHNNYEHHNKLMANFFAQTQALLSGRETEENPYRDFYGDRPTNTILISKLTPENLGALLAIYEHKTFVEGFLWNIFSFDQFGVELGKELATTILSEIESKKVGNYDSSTMFLLSKFLEKK
ncbi:MAG: glucose-6-phosphate isomerase [Flavobacteriaceae bacterium]